MLTQLFGQFLTSRPKLVSTTSRTTSSIASLSVAVACLSFAFPQAQAQDDPDLRPETTISTVVRNGPVANNGSSLTWTIFFPHQVYDVTDANFELTTTGTVTGAEIIQVERFITEYTYEIAFNVTAKTTGGEGTVSLSFANDTGMTHNVTNTKPPVSITVDRTAPVITSAPATVTRTAGRNGRATIGELTHLVTATDLHSVTITQTPRATTVLEYGTHVVTFTALDAAGNSSRVDGQVVVGFDPVVGDADLTPVVSTGSSVPEAGTNGLPWDTTIAAFFTPALDDFRTMAARITIADGKKKLGGIYLVDGTGTETLPAYQGQPLPLSNEGYTFKTFLDPVLSPGGSLAFSATMGGSFSTKAPKPTEDQGIWTDAFGGLARVLREGHPAPGLPDGVTVKAITSFALRDDRLVALIKLGGKKPAVNSGKDDVALLELTSRTTGRILLRTGMTLGNSQIKTIATLAPALASPGQGRWYGDQVVMAKVTLVNKDVQLVSVTSAGVITPLLSALDAAAAIDPTAKWKSFAVPAMGGAANGFAVSATLLPKAAGVTTKNDVALIARTGGQWQVFAREGDLTPISSASDGPRYATFFDPVVNEVGEVAFLATVAAKGVGAKNKTALFSGALNSLSVAARLGDFVPDENGQPTTAAWTKFVSHALPDTEDAGVIFLAETAGGDTTSKNKLGLWAVDQNGVLRRVLRTGTSLTPGGPLITTFTLLTSVPGSYGTVRSYNQTGSIAALVTFADKSQRLIRIDLP